jgi:hypothetical protein
MCHDVQIPRFENDNPTRWVSVNVLHCQNRKVTMQVKDKQRAFIEFLLLERCDGEKIVVHLRSIYGSAVHCRASVFRWISELRRDSEELRNEGCLGRLYRHETNEVIRSIR